MTRSCEEEDDGFHISSHLFEKPNHCLPCVSTKKNKIVNQLVSLLKVTLLALLTMFWPIKKIIVEQQDAHLVDQIEMVTIRL